MGLFSSLFRSRASPQNRTAASGYTFYFGSSISGKAVTERSAMQMTAVYSCVRILSETVAGLPLNLYRYTEDGGKEKAIDHPLYLLLHDEPNPEMSSFVFRETLMTHLLLWGNAYAQIIRNGKSEVIALYLLIVRLLFLAEGAESHGADARWETGGGVSGWGEGDSLKRALTSVCPRKRECAPVHPAFSHIPPYFLSRWAGHCRRQSPAPSGQPSTHSSAGSSPDCSLGR